MKILVLSNLYPPDVLGGYELACRQTAEALQTRGHDVRVLTCAPRKAVPPEPGVRRVFRLHDIYDGSIHVARPEAACRLRLGHATLIDAFNVHALIEEAAAFGPDVVYLQNLLGIGGLGLVAAVQHLGLPWVWHLEDDVPALLCLSKFSIVAPDAPPHLAREFADQAVGRYLSCSRGLVDEIEGQGVRLGDRVTMLTNWVTVRGDAQRDDYRPGGILRMVTAGWLSPYKGIDIAIEACRILRDEGRDDFRLDIYGFGKDTEFRLQVQKAGLGDRVALLGPRPHHEMLGLLRGYDVFLFPTWAREPFGIAPLEAAALGCVPILSHKNGIGEWLVDGVHCYKARRDPHAFARTIAEILDGRKPLAEVGRRAAAVVSDDFHLDRVIAEVERHLAEAAAGPRPTKLDPQDLYRLAVHAEKLMICQIQRPYAA